MANTTAQAQVCRHYPEAAFGGFAHCDGTIAFLSRVRSLLPERGIVLDVGCGRGSRTDDPCVYRRDLQDFRSPNRRIIGIDPDPRAASNPFLDEFRPLQIPDRWPVKDGEIGLVYADYVLEHLDTPDAFFAELDRVLVPGGYFCARTPNRWGYVSLAAQLVPNRLHARITGFVQRDRRAEDVFPTRYRCNTLHTIKRQFGRHGYECVVMRHETEPTYFVFSDALFRLARIVHALLPPLLRSTLFIFARKPA